MNFTGILKKNSAKSFYWLEWILGFENIVKKTKKIECARRNYQVENKFQKDVIWIIFDILLKESQKNKGINKILKSILTLFTIQYKPSCKKKKIFNL